ncbi:MAG: hypothetical protein KC910_04155 [Candidatus Eremiobacteraeota bacterium]|nr:hypothetical protein [Candidatus Eremiobacteraeota bacterium]
MRWLLLAMLLVAPAWAELSVEHQGKVLVSFDVPGLEESGRRDGKNSRITYTRSVEDGTLQVTVNVRRWIGIDINKQYYKDRDSRRENPHSRLVQDIEVAGTKRALAYRTSEPFDGYTLVLYTDDFRCEFLITGSKQAASAIEPTFNQLLKSVKIH